MNFDNLIMTTRIRLARNITGVPFNTKDRRFFQKIADSIVAHNPEMMVFNLEDLPERDSLFEQHLISAEFLQNTTTGILVIHKNNKISIMLGEEDHIRIQAITNRFNLLETYQAAKNIATQLEQDFNVARDPRLGYLTKCPTNLGSGMRASVMIYLPALTLTKKITDVFNQLDNNQLTIRGVYGENSDASGCIYQISNQNCIALTDQEILNMLVGKINELAAVELNLERELWQKSPDQIIDRVMRAWGLLTNAHLLTSQEAVEQLVWIKLGITLKILAFKNDRVIDDLFFVTKPATLTTNSKLKNADQITRDRLRAASIREKLLLFRIK